MPLFTPADLAAWTGGVWHGSPPAGLGPLMADTRRLQPGQVFVALKTEKRDGHDFLEAARAAGASAAIVANAKPALVLPQLVVGEPMKAWRDVATANRRRFSGPVVGVTGSVGKTSIKELLREIFGPGIHATQANENNALGVALTLCGLDPVVNRAAVIEAGINAPGEMAELAAMIQPDIALVTLIAAAHLEKLGSLDGVAHEKAFLARAVRPGGWTVIPASALKYKAFHNLPQPVAVVAQPEESLPSGWAARRFRFCVEKRPRNGWRLGLREDGGKERSWSLPPVTPGLAANAALAVVAAQLLGLADDRIQSGLALWRPAPLRGELLTFGKKQFLADCYNANPASMADALAGFALRVDPELPRLYVLGSMAELGPDAPALHRASVANLRLRPQDRALLLGPHAEDFRAALIATGHTPAQAQAVPMEAAEHDIAKFSGAVFLKGSRAYALEKLLPKSLREGREAHAPC